MAARLYQQCCKLRQSILFCLILLIASAACSIARSQQDPYHYTVQKLGRLNRSDMVFLHKIGKSTQGRPIFAVIITNPENPKNITSNRTRVLVLSGQHGNEPLPVHAVMELIHELSASRRDLAENTVVAFIPTVNPDGLVNNKRYNASGSDLNRDWRTLKQPETALVNHFIREFRPHVLIDLHEWTKDDTYQPNCIETPGFGTRASHRFSRYLGNLVARNTSFSPIPLKHTHYREVSEPGMAHRVHVNKGISSVLIETAPGYPASERIAIYKGSVKSIMVAAAAPSTRISKNDLAVVKRSQGNSSAWIGSSFLSIRNFSQDDRQAVCCAIALLAGAILLLLAATPKPLSAKTDEQYSHGKSHPNRLISLVQVAGYDLSIRERLELIQQRPRPSDRSRENSQSNRIAS